MNDIWNYYMTTNLPEIEFLIAKMNSQNVMTIGGNQTLTILTIGTLKNVNKTNMDINKFRKELNFFK